MSRRMFEGAKEGDPVRDSTGRNGVIQGVLDEVNFPVMVSFSNGEQGRYTVDGYGVQENINIVPRVAPINRMSRGEEVPRIKVGNPKWDFTRDLPLHEPKESILARGEVSTPDIRYDGNICWIPFAYHLLPAEGLAKVAAVMRIGEMKGRPDDGWRKVPTMEHVNHAISHLMAYVAGRHNDHHLANAACRVLMALDMDDKEPLPMASDSPKEDTKGNTGPEGPTLM